MRIRSVVLTLFFASLPLRSIGQQSVFETGNGDSSVFLSGRTGLVSYNLGDSTARFGYARDAGTANYFGHLAYGIGAGGTVDSNVAQVLNKNSPAPGGFVEGAVYWRQVFSKAPDSGGTQSHQVLNPAKCTTPPCPIQFPAHSYLPDVGLSVDGFIAQFHYGRTQFYLLPSAVNLLAIPAKTNFDQFRSTIAYNMFINSHSGAWTMGGAFAPGTANNLSDLKQETYQNQVTSPSGSGQTILSAKSQSVYVGTYQTYLSLPVNADAVFQPAMFKGTLGFDAILRSEVGGGSSDRFVSPGFGVFVFKPGSTDVPLGGVTYSYKNGKSQVAVVVGWTFGGDNVAPKKAAAAR